MYNHRTVYFVRSTVTTIVPSKVLYQRTFYCRPYLCLQYSIRVPSTVYLIQYTCTFYGTLHSIPSTVTINTIEPSTLLYTYSTHCACLRYTTLVLSTLHYTLYTTLYLRRSLKLYLLQYSTLCACLRYTTIVLSTLHCTLYVCLMRNTTLVPSTNTPSLYSPNHTFHKSSFFVARWRFLHDGQYQALSAGREQPRACGGINTSKNRQNMVHTVKDRVHKQKP